MGDVIDIFSKKQHESQEYFDRLTNCLSNAKELGTCSCDLCQLKQTMAADVVYELWSKCKEYDGNLKSPALFGGDVLEILVLASRKFLNDLSKN